MALSVIEGKVVVPRRIKIYGVHGVGKSVFGSMAPKPIFVRTEDGANDIDVPKLGERKAETFEEFMSMLIWVYETPHDYKTLVVDSDDWLEKLIWRDVCRANGKDNIEDFGYQRGYALSLDLWRKVIEALDAIREKRGMDVILIGHAQVTKFDDPANESYSRFMPALHKMASAMVCQWADEVLFATYKIYTKTADPKNDMKKRVIGVGGDERVIKTTERPSHVAKNRLNLPDEIPLDWREYEKFLPKPVTVTEPKLTTTKKEN